MNKLPASKSRRCIHGRTERQQCAACNKIIKEQQMSQPQPSSRSGGALTEEDVRTRQLWYMAKLSNSPLAPQEQRDYWLSEVGICNLALQSFRSEIAPTINASLSEAELMNLRPGPIQVVYPLDEEWNAALESAAKLCDEAAANANMYFDHMAEQIRALKRQRDERTSGT